MSFFHFLTTNAHYLPDRALEAMRTLRRIYENPELKAFYRPQDPEFEGEGVKSFEGPDPWDVIRLWQQYNQQGGGYDLEALAGPPTASSTPFPAEQQQPQEPEVEHS